MHELLAAAREAGPYVLVAHSYGGVVAMLYARTYPADVAGLVMVDVVTVLMKAVAKPESRGSMGRQQQNVRSRGT